MTAPGHRFGAQDGDAFVSRETFDFSDDPGKIVGEHEIGVGAKSRDPPGRLGRRFAKAAKILAPVIIDAVIAERYTQCFTIELRILPRTGLRAVAVIVLDPQNVALTISFDGWAVLSVLRVLLSPFWRCHSAVSALVAPRARSAGICSAR